MNDIAVAEVKQENTTSGLETHAGDSKRSGPGEFEVSVTLLSQLSTLELEKYLSNEGGR